MEKYGIAQESLRLVKDLNFEDVVFFKTGTEPERIDFLTRINLVSFEEADKEKVLADMDGLKIPFLHLNHLILSKKGTNRPQDKADIDILQKDTAV